MDYAKILSSLQARCAKREYCSQDIYEKALKLFEGDAESARKALESLREDGFVSDLRYASAFAREKAAISGWGPVKIRFALSAKRIEKEVIDQALGEIEAPRADARMRTLLENKWKTLAGDPQAKLKLIRFALSRGYDYDTVAPVINGISAGTSGS